MNEHTLKGQWAQLKGKIKTKWGKLTDDDLMTIDGRLDQLRGKIQERYGYAKEDVQREVDSFFKDAGTDEEHRKPPRERSEGAV